MRITKKNKEDSYGKYYIYTSAKSKLLPKISVLMAVHNKEQYLKSAIESILSQTFENIEIIVILDGLNNNDYDYLRNKQKQDNRIIVVEQENIGLTCSLNRGLNISRAKYVARQDGDDISHDRRIEYQYKYLIDNPKCAAIGTWYYRINNIGEIIGEVRLPTGMKGINRRLNRANAFCHGSVMFNKMILGRDLLYDEQYRYAQDYELWERLSWKYSINNMALFLYKQREHEKSISNNKIWQQSLYASMVIYRRIFKNKQPYGISLKDIETHIMGDEIKDKELLRIFALVLYQRNEINMCYDVLKYYEPLRYIIMFIEIIKIKKIKGAIEKLLIREK